MSATARVIPEIGRVSCGTCDYLHVKNTEVTNMQSVWHICTDVIQYSAYLPASTPAPPLDRSFLCAEEGDLRLIDQGDIDNWTTGRLQVFFEGSWSQVCATAFGAPDATVACRQLGFGAGTVVPDALSTEKLEELRRTNIYPEVAIIGASCTGTEEKLVDCSVNDGPRADGELLRDGVFGRDCLNSDGDGLVIGCVIAPLQGQLAGVSLYPVV